MNDIYHNVSFVVGLEAQFDEAGTAMVYPRFSEAWSVGPQGSRDASERLLRVKLEVPQSMWVLPVIRGKVKSDLQEEFQMFMEEIQ